MATLPLAVENPLSGDLKPALPGRDRPLPRLVWDGTQARGPRTANGKRSTNRERLRARGTLRAYPGLFPCYACQITRYAWRMGESGHLANLQMTRRPTPSCVDQVAEATDERGLAESRGDCHTHRGATCLRIRQTSHAKFSTRCVRGERCRRSDAWAWQVPTTWSSG